MGDFEKILLTAAMTVLGGFLIHSASQLFLKLFIEPLQDFKKYKFEAISLLGFYSNKLNARLKYDDSFDEKERYYKAQDEIRLCAANLKSAYYSINPRFLAVFLRIIPNQENFKQASRNLMSLSFLGSLNTEDTKASENYNRARNTVAMLGAEW
ncbi:hypothetical protein [Microbulbifer taiwanensis]|uniref:DUF4760 domain-containing protein n=1 Tax=Microbulbifer taiwanensis TaxID=986746 RepID=A0ABW1YRQ7_9GAMM|nr:hypothetical protein [Microbulbifer taiwanensis]